jgi:hypothetical protein
MEHQGQTIEAVTQLRQNNKLRLGQLQDALDLLHNEVLIPHFHFVEVLRVTSSRGVAVHSIVRCALELAEDNA